ncbi:MAG: radical SAM family heme chaperone HemW [Candidatus Gastranaerophilaceae bacterium]|jgi:oxygen-independent coproporphyrinogen-3 oxidase
MKPPLLESIYIHIPFCLQKCNYCSFISFIDNLHRQKEYFDALLNEISSASYDGTIKTIYIGGGTPSLIDISNYEKLFEFIYKKFKVSNTAEITLEVNPATGDLNYFTNLKKLGINRLSIGAQSFDDNILKFINRPHLSNDIKNTVKLAQKACFENISLDIIYGLPFQTFEILEKTLNECINLEIKHISTYGLKIEEGTVFYKKPPEKLPAEDLCADMYLKIIDILLKNDFEHYEISNFSKREFKSKHNINYWKNNGYYGFGLSAHGYIEGKRYANTDNFDKYLKNPLLKEFSNTLSSKDMMEEGIFLGLRMSKGISLKDFKTRYNVDICTKYSDIIQKYSELELLTVKNGHISLTTKGFMLSNIVMAEFLN